MNVILTTYTLVFVKLKRRKMCVGEHREVSEAKDRETWIQEFRLVISIKFLLNIWPFFSQYCACRHYVYLGICNTTPHYAVSLSVNRIEQPASSAWWPRVLLHTTFSYVHRYGALSQILGTTSYAYVSGSVVIAHFVEIFASVISGNHAFHLMSPAFMFCSTSFKNNTLGTEFKKK